MTDRFKYKKRALDEETVKSTWTGILQDDDGLSTSWVTDISVAGVLVGMDTTRRLTSGKDIGQRAYL